MHPVLSCPTRDQRGAVFVEKLIVVLPLLLTFFLAWELAELGAAQLVVQRASAAAGRAAVVVLPDDPAFYGGEPEHSYSGQRRDDIELAAGMILSAIPRMGDDFEVEISDPPEEPGPIDVAVSAAFDCGLASVLCGEDSSIVLAATTSHTYQGARYAYGQATALGSSSSALMRRKTQVGGTSQAVTGQGSGSSSGAGNGSCRVGAGGSAMFDTDYGNDPSSRAAAEYRCEKKLFSGQNVAVIWYEDENGDLKKLVEESGNRHSEKMIWAKLPEHVQKDPDRYIKEVYTEREPCDKSDKNCAGWLREDRTNGEDFDKPPYNGPVTWHFDYNDDRAGGNKQHKQKRETAACQLCRREFENKWYEGKAKRPKPSICDRRLKANPDVKPQTAPQTGPSSAAANGCGCTPQTKPVPKGAP